MRAATSPRSRFARWLSLGLAVMALLVACLDPALADKRVALVVGNSNYANVAPLANPRNDASDMIARLRALGFEVVEGLDLDRSGLLNRLLTFGRAAENADVALFFYAGHGLQVNGQNYLVPTDARVEYEAELDLALVPMPLVMQQLARGSRVNIVLLDACRDNPFAKDLSRTLGTRSSSALGRGLSRVQSASGTFIAFATQPDNVAQDGDGRNSPFTRALLANLDKPNISLSDLMIDVRNEVMRQTGGKQIPWDSSSLTGRFSFKIEGTVTIGPQAAPAPAPVAPSTPAIDPRTLEYTVWTALQNTNDREALTKFLADFPNGLFAGAARDRLARLSAPVAAPTTESDAETARRLGMTFEANTDRPGSDYRQVGNVATPGACAEICGREDRCKAWSWVRPGIQGPEPQCWLKSAAPASVAASFAVSGVRRATGAACAGVPGVWSWFANGDVTFRAGGTLTQGQLTGTWTCNDADGSVTIAWNHGYTDRLALSLDGARMSGANNAGGAISGQRKNLDVAAVAPGGQAGSPGVRDAAGRVVFTAPTINGARIDWCETWGANCGKPAADAFCRARGFEVAVNWQVTGLARTWVAGSGRYCESAGACMGWSRITCGQAVNERPEKLFREPRVNGVIADWCADWGTDCGQAGAEAFCRTQGFPRAVGWRTATTPKTWVIGARKVCAFPSCIGLRDVGCAR